MKDTTTTENALLLPQIEQVAAAFQSQEALEALIAVIEAECRAEHYTVATREGRERIKSQAYRIARSKTALDDVGKGLTEEARKLIDATNGLRKIAVNRLDALKDEIRAPLTAWENAEEDRKKAIKDRINTEFGMRALPASSAALRAIQKIAIAVELDDTFGEFVADAAKAKDAFLRHLEGKIQEAVRVEEREAEIARLREEAAAREKRDAEERDRQAKESAAIEAERMKLAEERRQMQAEADARAAEVAAENARLRAELDAMKQAALPIEPVQTDEPVVAAAPAIAMSGDNFEVVAEIRPVLSIERQISAAVIEILRQCHTHEAMADEIASAIVGGQIPHVEVVK